RSRPELAGCKWVEREPTTLPWRSIRTCRAAVPHTVLIDPAQSGSSLGPATNLPFHHDVGMGGKAFEPFDRGGWNPTYDVPAPLPWTQFGPVTSPPSVPPLPTGGAVQF